MPEQDVEIHPVFIKEKELEDADGEDGEPTDGEDGEPTDGEDGEPADGEDGATANGEDGEPADGEDGKDDGAKDAENPFTDVIKSGENDPYYDAVVWAANNGIVKGTSATSFDPKGTATRVQFTTMLHRALKDKMPGTPGETSKFADCQDLIADYTDAVLWAESLTPAIIEGTGPDTFDPNAPITRAQVVTLIWRAAGKPAPSATGAAFTDLSANWYRDAVIWGAEKGIVKGTSATTFDPDTAVTREQLATFLYRAFEEAKVL